MNSDIKKEQVYCISLLNSKRKLIFEKTINTFGMQFTYYNAIDSSEFKDKENNYLLNNILLTQEQNIFYKNKSFNYQPHTINIINNKFSGINAIACTLSHCDLYAKLLESSYEYFLILEDDFRFTDNLKIQDLIQDIQDIPDNCDLCFFSPSHAHKSIYPKEINISPRIFKLKNKINYFSGASFYLITRQGAKKLLNIQGNDSYKFSADDVISVLSCSFEPNFYMTHNLYGFGHCHVYPEMIERMNLI